MKKVVYLIGNGFDLNLNLKTNYSDFYELNTHTSDPSIIKLKEHLKNDKNGGQNYKYWSDLEEAMGSYTTNFKSKEEMKKVYDNLNDRLRDYIQTIEHDGIKGNINKSKLISDIARPDKYLNAKYQNDLRRFCEKYGNSQWETHIISFNYTNTIESILGMTTGALDLGNTILGHRNILCSITHIHGLSDAPLIGVNDTTQIENEEFRNDEEIQDLLIKPMINVAIGDLKADISIQNIKTAIIICLFGISLGKTDNLWWATIGECLKRNDCRVIYFVHAPDAHPRPNELKSTRKTYIKLLLSKTRLTEEEKK